MNAELIAVGTEILLGSITNTNASYLARELSRIGVDSYYQQVVGDNPQRLDAAITVAEQRSDLIIVMGGLGPTADDLSKQTLAAHLGLGLETDAQHLAKLDAFARQRQHALTPNNRVQAQLPAGAIPLVNHNGLAVGALLAAQGRTYVLLPGPPREFRVMVDRELIPRLAGTQDHLLRSRTLRFFGLGESALVTAIADIIEDQTNPTVASYIEDYEVTLRLTVSGQDETVMTAQLEELQAAILDRIGDYYYGTGKDLTLAQAVGQRLLAANLSFSAAESLTAGAFQAEMATVPGISAVFAGGFVTYSAVMKAKMLGIDPEFIAANGVVSDATAAAMAAGCAVQVGSDYGLGFTGVAGPDTLEGQPAGTVWIGLKTPTGTTAHEYHLSGDRNAVRRRAVKTGLMLLLKALNAAEIK